LFLDSGRECKVITGIDDHSPYRAIATVVYRVTGQAVCAAFCPCRNRRGRRSCPARSPSSGGCPAEGAIIIGEQRVQVGLPHAGKTVTITVGSEQRLVQAAHREPAPAAASTSASSACSYNDG
jgi:hypothetical protein